MRCLPLILLILLSMAVMHASEDAFAPPLYSETRFELPAPYKNGKIVAQARLTEVGDDRPGSKGTIVDFSSLKVSIGSETLDVPTSVLELFRGANLSSIQFFIGPPDMPEFPLYSKNPDPSRPAYFLLSFRYGGWSYDARLSGEAGPTAHIVIHESKIVGLSSHEQFTKDGEFHMKSVDYDPITLKVIDRLQNAQPSSPPNHHPFGTSGTSAAEQPLMPEAGGGR